MELLLYIVRRSVGLNDFNASERLVKHTHQLAHTPLAQTCRVAQLLHDTADNKAHQRQEEDREECQLPRYAQHQNDISDNEERLAKCHLQSVGNTVLHNQYIGGYTRHNITLALVAKIADILAYHAVKHRVTHTLNCCHAQVLNRISTEVAEEV